MTEVPNSDQVYLNVGDMVRLRLPYSEVCIHMKVAGKSMRVQVVLEGRSPMAQLYSDSGLRFSFPILLSEAGIYTDSTDRFYVPARSIAPPLRLRLFVPVPYSPLSAKVAPGSAIVGEDTGQPQVRVDYEGNIHGAVNLHRYWERALQAAARHLANYPTVARSLVPRDELLPVGWWDVDQQEVSLETSEGISWLVATWLGLASDQGVDPAELNAQSASNQQQLGNMEV